LAGLEGVDPVKCSRGVVLVPDSSLDSALLNVPYDAIILPGGGPGAKALAESAKVLFTILGTQRCQGDLKFTRTCSYITILAIFPFKIKPNQLKFSKPS